MRLNRTLCLGGKYNGRIIKGIKYRGYYIYPNTYSEYNIYMVEIPEGGATLYFENAAGRAVETREPYYDFGNGVKNPVLGSATVFSKNCTTYTYETAGTYQIITTEFLLNPGNKHYLREVVALRSDLKDAYRLFASNWGFESFENLQLDALEEVTTMLSMFYDCADLQTVVFANSSFPKLAEMTTMFYNCTSLKSVDFSYCDLSNVSEMLQMFVGCDNLEIADFSYCNLSGLTNLERVFAGPCKSINLSGATFGSVTNMYGTFYDNSSLIEIDLSMIDTSHLTDASYLFSGCTSLESVDLSNFDLTNATNTSYMFWDCTSLHTLILDNCSKDTISKIIYLSNLPKYEDEEITHIIHCREEDVAGLTPPKGWKFEPIIEPDEPPVEPDEPIEPPVEPEEPTIPLYQLGQFSGDTTLTEVRTMVNSTHTDLSDMFNGCTNLVSVNTTDWDTSNVADMSYMFRNCTSLTELDLSSFDTSNHRGAGMFDYMFYGCTSLETLDIRNFYINYYDSEEGYMAQNTFTNCNSLHTIYMNNCGAYTIKELVNSLPYNQGTGKIYVSRYNLIHPAGYTIQPPSGWRFEYID